jgi:lysozyme family protein
VNLTSTLSKEYRELWKTCQIRQQRRGEIDGIVDRIVKGKNRYRMAGKPHGVPWHVVAVIHMLEGSGSFSTHLHNGDPLTARTVHDPKGRPKAGSPPFSWEKSASDALVFDGLSRWTDWSLAGTLFVLERFNGFGYRRHDINIHSPYLWSFSNHYTKGKFVADRVFSATAVSKQCGAAVLLKRMVGRKLVKIEGATGNGSLPNP